MWESIIGSIVIAVNCVFWARASRIQIASSCIVLGATCLYDIDYALIWYGLLIILYVAYTLRLIAADIWRNIKETSYLVAIAQVDINQNNRRLLMETRANLNLARDNFDFIEYVCKAGNLPILKAALEVVPDQWLRDHSSTCLRNAMLKGHFMIVRALIEYDPYIVVHDDHEAFRIACAMEQSSTIREFYAINRLNMDVIYYYDKEAYIMVPTSISLNIWLCFEYRGYAVYSTKDGQKLLDNINHNQRICDFIDGITKTQAKSARFVYN